MAKVSKKKETPLHVVLLEALKLVEVKKGWLVGWLVVCKVLEGHRKAKMVHWFGLVWWAIPVRSGALWNSAPSCRHGGQALALDVENLGRIWSIPHTGSSSIDLDLVNLTS